MYTALLTESTAPAPVMCDVACLVIQQYSTAVLVWRLAGMILLIGNCFTYIYNRKLFHKLSILLDLYV